VIFLASTLIRPENKITREEEKKLRRHLSYAAVLEEKNVIFWLVQGLSKSLASVITVYFLAQVS